MPLTNAERSKAFRDRKALRNDVRNRDLTEILSILREIKAFLASLRNGGATTVSPLDSPPSGSPLHPLPNPPLNPPTRILSNSPSAFDRWWEGYPDKVGKGAAKRAFTKALTKTSLDQLIAGVERYKATKPIDRPWCNPSTWLNQERWLDVPASNGAYTGSELPFGGPPKEPPPIPEGGFFPVGRHH